MWRQTRFAAAAMFGLGMAFAQDAGETIYQTNCVACHQATGQGLPGVFPPLAGHVPDLLTAEGGREYLIHVLLYGLQGPIDVEGQTYNGLMPAWGQLDDSQIASILNYVATAWGNEAALPEGFEDFVAEEIAGERDLGLTPSEVHSQRSELEGAE